MKLIDPVLIDLGSSGLSTFEFSNSWDVSSTSFLVLYLSCMIEAASQNYVSSPLASINQSFCDEMPRYKDESPAVRVYTVSDESRYLIVRNVPALGCGDDLLQLFSSYGQVDECKPMDAEDCEPYTDVYCIKFRLFSNARFAKRKLDDSVFLGNRLQISYAPHFETLSDTKDKLEGRRREVLARLNSRRSKGTAPIKCDAVATSSNTSFVSEHLDHNGRELEFRGGSQCGNLPIKTISSNEDYFSSHSMNQTVRLVRDKLDKIQSSGEHLQPGSASKKARVDNRRRI